MAEHLSLYHHTQEPTSITSLSTEILSDDDPQAINTVRRVCRTFYELAAPLIYETVHINQQITNPEALSSFPHAPSNIHAHTRHIVLRSGLDRQSVGILLNNLQKLRSVRYICLPLLSETPGLTTPDLRWSFICNTGPTYNRWVPSDINSLTAHDPSKIKIHIEGLPLVAPDGKHADLYRSVIPSQSLVSLETTAQQTTAICAVEPYLPALKNLLLASRSLEIFRYRDNRKATRFYFKEGERLPAFKELTLRSYDWTHGIEGTDLQWDFSRIRSLELVNVSVYNFFTSVTSRLEDFANLHTLRVDDFGNQHRYTYHRGDGDGDSTREESQRAAASSLLHRLIRDNIHTLQTLHLTCDLSSFHIDALLCHAGTLKDLVFRDHRASSYPHPPSTGSLTLTSLKRLAKSMKKLESLEIDLNILEGNSPTRHLVQLTRFPRLQNLTLNIQTPHGVGSPSQTQSQTSTCGWYTNSPAQDPDETCAKRIFHILARNSNQSSPAEWESITVKIGAWQPGYTCMYSYGESVYRSGNGRNNLSLDSSSRVQAPYHHRVSEAKEEDEIKTEIWKSLLNKRGLFVKRCFVMDIHRTTAHQHEYEGRKILGRVQQGEEFVGRE